MGLRHSIGAWWLVWMDAKQAISCLHAVVVYCSGFKWQFSYTIRWSINFFWIIRGSRMCCAWLYTQIPNGTQREVFFFFFCVFSKCKTCYIEHNKCKSMFGMPNKLLLLLLLLCVCVSGICSGASTDNVARCCVLPTRIQYEITHMHCTFVQFDMPRRAVTPHSHTT